MATTSDSKRIAYAREKNTQKERKMAVKVQKLNDYVATLTKKGGGAVLAVRVNKKQNVTEARKQMDEMYPHWNVKSIARLSDEDFK